MSVERDLIERLVLDRYDGTNSWTSLEEDASETLRTIRGWLVERGLVLTGDGLAEVGDQ